MPPTISPIRPNLVLTPRQPAGPVASPGIPGRPATPAPFGADRNLTTSSVGSQLARSFDPGLAARTVMAKFGNHDGMLIVIQARGGDHQQFSAKQRADALAGIRGALGLPANGPLPTALDLRDMDHYINMFGPIQDAVPVHPQDGFWKRTLEHAHRDFLGLISGTMAIGYTAAKAIAQHPTWLFPPSILLSHSTYLNGPTTSRASLHEMEVGLQGVWDGVTDDIPVA